MNKIVQLKSYNSEGIEIGDVYPVTKSEGILLTNGKHLEEKLSEIDEIKENNKNFSAQLEQIDNETFKKVKVANNIKLFSHRGFQKMAPENTLPAFICASEYGYDGIECDIQETADGHFVVLHDETVDRTTNGTGKVSELTLEQIKQLNVDTGNNISSYSNLKVPTIQEMFNTCKIYNLIPLIEIKTITNVNNFLNVISECGFINDCIIISFNNLVLEEIRSINKYIKIQFLTGFTKENIDYCESKGFGIDVLNSEITADLVNYAHSKNVLVNCYTVLTYKVYNNLLNTGVDFITADDVQNRNSLAYKITDLNNSLTSATDVIENIVLGNKSGIGTLYKYIFNDGASKTRAYFKNKFLVSKMANKIEIIIPSGFRYSIMPFNNKDIYYSDTGWSTATLVNVPNGCKYFTLFFSKEDNSELTNDDLSLLKTTTIRVGKITEGRRMYVLPFSNGIPNINTNYSYDNASIEYFPTEREFLITHSNPFYIKNGVATAFVSASSSYNIDVRTRGQTNTTLKLSFYKDGVKCTQTTLQSESNLWVNVIHEGYDFLEC